MPGEVRSRHYEGSMWEWDEPTLMHAAAVAQALLAGHFNACYTRADPMKAGQAVACARVCVCMLDTKRHESLTAGSIQPSLALLT